MILTSNNKYKLKKKIMELILCHPQNLDVKATDDDLAE